MKHYFSDKPETPSDRARVETRIRGIDLNFVTDAQVFSKKHIDFGTRQMLESAIADIGARGIGRGRLLDLGCGYGPVGITMKRVFPAMDIVMIDINERAIGLSRENAELNHSSHVSILQSDGFSAVDGAFDIILTNPPVRAGKKAVFSFFEGSYEHLNAGGLFYTVLQKKQGAPSAVTKLTELFGNCSVLKKEGGYWILGAVRTGAVKDEQEQ